MSERVPSLRSGEVIRRLLAAGFIIRRQTASHVILHRDGLRRPVPVPVHSRELRRALLLRIIAEAGLTVEQFTNLGNV